jgi:hypothetical protein
MRRVAPAASVLAFLLLAAPAVAKAPKPADLPTVEEIYQQAKKSIDEAAKRAIEQARDPNREAIEGYRDRKLPLNEYQKLVEIINDSKNDNVQPYRADAAQALVLRFTREEEADPQVRAIRRSIALAVLDLMKADKRDETGLRAIETILFAWYRNKMQVDVKFKPSDKLDSRRKAYSQMKKHIEKDL